MYAQCPECLTIYKIAPEILARGHGVVACGYCSANFDALRTLTAQLPPEPVERLHAHMPEPEPPVLSMPALRPAPAQSHLFSFDPDARPPRKSGKSERRVHTPAFARIARPRAGRRNWPWVVAGIALVLGLGAQLAYAERELLLHDPTVRPWLDEACAALHCALPPRKDPSRLELLSRDIRPHPSVGHALIISATLRNAAAFAQPFPSVEIILSDLDENRVGMRRFQAREYVTDPKSLAHGMDAGATAALVFEVADPGKNAVAFEFRFY